MVSSKPILVSTFIAWSVLLGSAAAAEGQCEDAPPASCATCGDDHGSCSAQLGDAQDKYGYHCACKTGSQWTGSGYLVDDREPQALCEFNLVGICHELDPEHLRLTRGAQEYKYTHITGRLCRSAGETGCERNVAERHAFSLLVKQEDPDENELSITCPRGKTYSNDKYEQVVAKDHEGRLRQMWGNLWNESDPRQLSLAILDADKARELVDRIKDEDSSLAQVASEIIDESCKTITAGLANTGKADDAAIEEDAIGCALAPTGRPTLLLALGLLALLARRRRASGPR